MRGVPVHEWVGPDWSIHHCQRAAAFAKAANMLKIRDASQGERMEDIFATSD